MKVVYYPELALIPCNILLILNTYPYFIVMCLPTPHLDTSFCCVWLAQ